jgi:hypothetical protein
MTEESRSPFSYLGSIDLDTLKSADLQSKGKRALYEALVEIRGLASRAAGGAHGSHYHEHLDADGACQAIYRLADACHNLPYENPYSTAPDFFIKTSLRDLYETGEAIYNGKPPFPIRTRAGEFSVLDKLKGRVANGEDIGIADVMMEPRPLHVVLPADRKQRSTVLNALTKLFGKDSEEGGSHEG